MKNRFNILLFCTMLLMVACTQSQSNLQAGIKAMESKIANSTTTDTAACDSVIHLYENYCSQFKDDTCCADYFFKAAELSVRLGKYQQAVEFYGNTQRFTVYRKGARALFLQGFISENNLHDKNAAREYYTRFIIKFPNHKMTPEVKMLLESLNMTDEMLIKQLQQANNTSITKNC
ncbi:MAG: tetratricopeptide repeat protein [Bacteroidota bacterium]